MLELRTADAGELTNGNAKNLINRELRASLDKIELNITYIVQTIYRMHTGYMDEFLLGICAFEFDLTRMGLSGSTRMRHTCSPS